jgi:nitrous oxidase accessory protein NosD
MNYLKNSTRRLLPHASLACTKMLLVLCLLLQNKGALFGIPDPDWCSLSPHYSIPSGQTSKISFLIPGSTIATGRVFVVGSGATLEVDKTFVFNYCYFICGEGAKINIVSGSGLGATKCYSFSSKYFSCTAMWEGITVMPGTTIDFRGNQIYDAAKAINFPPQYNSVANRLTDNVFENNTYGLYIGQRPSSFSANVGFVRCYGNTFAGTQTLLNGKPFPEAGIQVIQTSSLLFGTSGGAKNTFKSMTFGIKILRASFASIAHSDFIHLMDTDPNEVVDGSGILVNGSSATITQAGVSRCQFEDNESAGVYIKEAAGWVNVDHSDFKGTQPYGIRYDATSVNTYLTFLSNTFELEGTTCKSAIKVIRPPASALIPSSMINENDFHFIPQAGLPQNSPETFIKVDGISGAFNQFQISQNTIDNQSSNQKLHGIYVAGMGDNYEVSQNQIYYLAPESSMYFGHACLGIVFDGLSGEGNTIRFNYITSQLRTISTNVDLDDKSFIKCAIHVHSSNRPSITCNTTDNTYRGVHFSEMNTGTDFAENIMERHVFGVEFRKNTTGGSNTTIDDQVLKFNRWLSDPGSVV